MERDDLNCASPIRAQKSQTEFETTQYDPRDRMEKRIGEIGLVIEYDQQSSFQEQNIFSTVG
jgi:hypothetical protein